MLVLQRLLHGGQARARGLPLARLDLSVGRVAVWLVALIPDLFLEDVQVEVAQGLWAQAAALEALVGGDVRIGLQQIGDAAEDLRVHAIGMERLEQEKRLEVGVGGQASSHPPEPLGLVQCARAARGRRERSHGDGDGDGGRGCAGGVWTFTGVAWAARGRGCGAGRWGPRGVMPKSCLGLSWSGSAVLRFLRGSHDAGRAANQAARARAAGAASRRGRGSGQDKGATSSALQPCL
jgi:hypothetical protein